jgi:hypothetical protein
MPAHGRVEPLVDITAVLSATDSSRLVLTVAGVGFPELRCLWLSGLLVSVAVRCIS